MRPTLAKHCFILRTGPTVEFFKEMYDRKNIILKIFDLEEIKTEEDFKTVKWGNDPRKGQPKINTTLFEATQIQNIAAFHGLAPKVYGVNTLSLADKLVPVQITEDVGIEESKTQEEADTIYRKVVELGKEYGFGIQKEDVSKSDVIGGKLVDFQTFSFTTDYKETAKKLYMEAEYGKVYYQDVDIFGLKGGPRKSGDRVGYLQLEKVNFKHKTVLDVGCAGGFFLRYALLNGAKRGFGIDIDPKVIKGAFNVCNLMGLFNVDFQVIDVTKDKLDDMFDIIFFLSMNYHVQYPSWIIEATKELMIFEDNSGTHRNERNPEETISKRFAKVEYVGSALDHGDKSCYHLTK